MGKPIKTEVEDCGDGKEKVTLYYEGRTRIIYRSKNVAAKSVSRISCKNPFRSRALGVHQSDLAEHIETTNIPKGMHFEPADNGFADPVFDSLGTWKKYLKATNRHDRDGYC